MRARLIWVIAIVAVSISGIFLMRPSALFGPPEQSVKYSEMLNKVQSGEVKDVTIDGNTIVGHFRSGEQFRTDKPNSDPEMYRVLLLGGVNITSRDHDSNLWVNTLISIIPFAFLMLICFAIVYVLVYLLLRNSVKPVDSH